MSVEILEPRSNEQQTGGDPPFDGYGVLAEFAGPRELVQAARTVREAGYTRLDAYSPFPIHGMDDAVGIRPTVLPWIVLCVGCLGGAGALLMQWWMNAVDYPFLISGKPLFSLPANIPVTFEVIILSSAFATFFGMLALNRLPRHSSPLLDHHHFRRVTNDCFFLFVPADDPTFDHGELVALYRRAGARRIDDVAHSASPDRLPGSLKAVAAVAVTLALVPPALIALARNTTSELPRIDFFSDMDSQGKFKAQESSRLFADRRAMRPQVVGTIAVGELQEDDAFYRGILPSDESETPTAPSTANTSPDGTSGAGEAEEPNYVTRFPLPVTDSLMQRGRVHFNVYCAPCHGKAGQGDGLISLRALELQEPTWVPPTNLTNEVVSAQPIGKLYETITHGRRKMAGYAAQIQPEDRWAIVLYLRALQRSGQATLDDVPAEEAEILETQR